MGEEKITAIQREEMEITSDAAVADWRRSSRSRECAADRRRIAGGEERGRKGKSEYSRTLKKENVWSDVIMTLYFDFEPEKDTDGWVQRYSKFAPHLT